MVKSETYTYLTQHLSEAMEKEFAATRKPEYKTKTLIGLGKTNKVWSSWIETLLTDLFEQFLCLDKEKRVLVGEDGATLYAYNGAFFEQIDVKAEKFIAELIKRTMRALKIGSMYVQKCPVDIAKNIVSTLTSSDEYLYKSDRRYIAFENGIFDVEKGSLKKFNIKYRPFIALDLEYRDEKECYKAGAEEYGVGDNPCKLWETKIKEIIPNNDARDAFQQFCGSLILNREAVKVEYICYLVGTGSNGKSVVASTIANVFGDKFFSRFSLRQLFKNRDAGVNIAALDGKICNLIGDLEAKDVNSGGDFKRAISGEWFQGRKNYKDPIMVKFPPLLCATNELPESQDDSWGYHRRQLPIYTTTRQWTEEDKDPYLTQKLSVPLARMYVFLWIYAGMKKILRNNGNIILGEDVIRAQKVLQNHANSARAWWADSGYVVIEEPEKKDPRWRPLRDLYQEYCTYATEQGYGSLMKSREVSNMLKSQGYSKEKGNIRRMPSGDEYCIGRPGYDTTENGELICGV